MDDSKRRIQDFTELAQFELDPASVRLLPLAYCQRNSVVVLGQVDRTSAAPVTVGTLNPHDDVLLRSLSALWQRPVRAVALNAYEIRRALEVGYPTPGEDRRRAARHQLALDGRPAGIDAEPAALVDDLLRQALRLGATDIHLECYRDDVDARLRIDGVLHQLQTPISPDSLQGVLNRLKILSGLDITERRIPQDGRFRVLVTEPDASRTGRDDWDCDFRLSITPGPHGEDAVVRVLGGRVGVLPVESLGLSPATRAQLLSLLANPEGLILVTGPTGSGKTTTLYSALAHLTDGTRKVLTAEDPIEYEIPKVNQKQTSPQLALSALARAFLRQDPDVILIGEIRDTETADIAVRAAATGHVVLSTLHTSDALGAIHRLKGLGLEVDRLAEALLGVVAQRLLRRICPACAAPCPPSPLQQQRLGPLLDGLQPQRGVGCPACHGTGYRGRVGIFELVVVDLDLQDMLAEGAHIHDIRETLAARGFVSLVDDALDKVRQGITSLDEVVRVLPYRTLSSMVSRRRAPDRAPAGPGAPAGSGEGA